jgi:hypothetical protein
MEIHPLSESLAPALFLELDKICPEANLLRIPKNSLDTPFQKKHPIYPPIHSHSKKKSTINFVAFTISDFPSMHDFQTENFTLKIHKKKKKINKLEFFGEILHFSLCSFEYLIIVKIELN